MMKTVSIHIGEYFACREPATITTLLGSCVSVCLFEPGVPIGGMNHIFLPGDGYRGNFASANRYGVNLMEMLINTIMKLGGNRKKLVAKVFGGGRILPSMSSTICAGDKNISFALNFLDQENIHIVARDVGGNDSRKILFSTDTGQVLLKRIRPALSQSIAAQERNWYERAAQVYERAGSIVLFEKDET